MKKIFLTQMFLVLLCCRSVSGAETNSSVWGRSELPSPFNVPFYTGSIFPTPQSAEYYDDFIPFQRVAVLVGTGIALGDPRIDVLRARVAYMGGELVVTDTLDTVPADATIVALGETSVSEGVVPPEREQGYVIKTLALDGRHVIAMKGFDQQGLLWAITSLNQLVTHRDGALFVRRVEVADYPAHILRGFLDHNWHRHIWHSAQQVSGGTPVYAMEEDGFYSTADEQASVAGQSESEAEDSVVVSSSRWAKVAVSDAEGRAWYVLNAKMNYIVTGMFQRTSGRRGWWRDPPCETSKETIRRTGELLSPLGIQWFGGYNPCPRKCPDNGPSILSRNNAGIDTGLDRDFLLIMRDAGLLAQAGGGFFLAFDDYRFWLLYEEWRRFGTAREADTWFLRKFYNALLDEYGSAKIIFCPPFYWGPKGGDAPNYGEGREKYLEKLGGIPGDIDVFWTGPRVGATSISEENKEWVAWIHNLIDRKPVFWQNMSRRGSRCYSRWWPRAFYEGFYDDIKVYLPNCSMPARALLMMTLADYMWNPDAYDADNSAQMAIKILMGPEGFDKIEELNKVLDYFTQYNATFGLTAHTHYDLDKAGRERVAANITEIRRLAKKAKQLGDELVEVSPEVTRWSFIARHAVNPTNLKDRIEDNSELRRIIYEVDKMLESAVNETGMDPDTDTFLAADAFSGGINDRTPRPPGDPMQEGQDEIFSILAETRPATWLTGPEALSAGFFLVDPSEKDYTLIVSGQERDLDPPSDIRIYVNDQLVYEGGSGLPRHDWARVNFTLPMSKLQRGHNTLRIENSGVEKEFPRFLLNYAVITR